MAPQGALWVSLRAMLSGVTGTACGARGSQLRVAPELERVLEEKRDRGVHPCSAPHSPKEHPSQCLVVAASEPPGGSQPPLDAGRKPKANAPSEGR